MARNFKRQPVRTTVAIVGDGETERIYFSDVRDTDRPKNLAIFPDYPRKIGSYTGVLSKALELIENYDHVFALVDVDKVIQDHQQAVYAQAKAAAEHAGIKVLENNPCFEIWLLLHFGYTTRMFANCGQVSDQLNHNSRLPGYNKSERFVRQTRLYGSLKQRLRDHAIPNARRLETNRQHDPLFPRAETFRFFEWYFAEYP